MACYFFLCFISFQDKRNKSGESEVTQQLKKKKNVYEQLLTQKNCKFYTNLYSLELFKKLHDYIAPHVRRRYNSQTPKLTRQFTRTPVKMGPSRKLSSYDEFLLVLMKLRLGSLNQDLADRFSISLGTVSNIFTSWIKAMGQCLKPLVYIPDQGTINVTSPARFKSYHNLSAIIDCSEVFIETPKDPELQSVTWSDYKHHNTLKFLVAVAPNSAITYVSEFYTGRVSDKQLTIDCGFLDMVEPYSMIMADKGFNLFDECAARRV